MRSRALIHVAGPPGGGKTTLIERLLEYGRVLCLAARCVKDASTAQYEESFPKRDAELTRYRRAGATGTARLLVPEGEDAWDDFYSGRFMEEYSEAVLLEGDSPVSHVDLRVFVARPIDKHARLLVPARPASAQEQRADDLMTMRGILDDPAETERLLVEMLGAPYFAMMKARPGAIEKMRQEMLKHARAGFPGTVRKPAAQWALAPGYRGIEAAQVVVVNVRSETDRKAADRMLADLRRIREDDTIRRDIMGIRGTKIPITALAADLADPGDPGVKKVIRRVQRSISSCAR